MFQLIEQLHNISTKNNLKLAPEKPFFMLLKVKFLGLEIGYQYHQTHTFQNYSYTQDSFTHWKNRPYEFHRCAYFLHQIHRKTSY